MLKIIINIFIFCFVFQSALYGDVVSEVEFLIRKHSLTSGLTREQKFHGYAVLARELELHGYSEKSIEYYNLSIKNLSDKEDPLEVYTSLLAVMYQQDKSRAKKLFNQEFRKGVERSKSSLKKEILNFWQSVFSSEIHPKLHHGFYGEFFKDKDVAKLVAEKKYELALKFLNPVGLEKRDINSILQYDVISKLSGKNSGFYCEKMLGANPKSPSVTLELCRYLKNKKLLFSDLEGLIRRTQEELPHLEYLAKALRDIK